MNAHASHTDHKRESLTVSARFKPFETLILVLCLVAIVYVYLMMIAEPVPENLETTTVRIEESQTLWDLAIKHPICGLDTIQTVEYIKQMNGMHTSALQAGEVLLVPTQSGDIAVLAAR